MKEKNDASKGEFQHRMFKLVILIVVFIFFCLIIGFIYITVTSSSTKNTLKIVEKEYQTEESILKSNEKYYKVLKAHDSNNYNYIKRNNKTDLLECNKIKFYKSHITRHIPCVYKFNDEDNINILNNIKNKNYINLNSKDVGVINFVDKFMKLQSIEFYNKDNYNNDYFKKPKLDNIGRIIINNSIKKVHIYLSPISQIEFFNSYQNKSNSEIVNFYLKNDIDDKIKDKSGEIKNVIYYEFDLDEADFIYIPSYYFIQIKDPVDNLISYEYQDISSFNDIVFKILYSS